MTADGPLPVPNPYPDADVAVARLRYTEALWLVRLADGGKVQREGSGADFVVGADYTVTWEDGAGAERHITVPRGMLTDLASVPPLFRSLVSRTGPWVEAAVVHDFLTVAWRAMDGRGTVARRAFADAVMRAAMDEAGVNPTSKQLIHGAIRAAALFGYPRFERPVPWSCFAADLERADLREQLAAAR